MSALCQKRTLRRLNVSNSVIALASAKMCIAEAIDLCSGKSRRQRVQRYGLQPIMRWSAEQRIADHGGNEYAVLPALQELCRRTLQLRGDSLDARREAPADPPPAVHGIGSLSR